MQLTARKIISRIAPLHVSARLLVLCSVGACTPSLSLAVNAPNVPTPVPRQQTGPNAVSKISRSVADQVKMDSVSETAGDKATDNGQPQISVPHLVPEAALGGTGARNRESLPLGPMPVGNYLPRSGLNTESQSSTESAFTAFWPLALIVAIILGAAYFVRKLAKGDPGLVAALGAGGKSPSGVLEVLGRYPVSRTSSFILLRLDRRILLLNQSFGKAGTGFSTLAELTDAEEVASILIKVNQGESKSMHSYLDVAMKQMENEQPAANDAAEEPVDTVDVSFTPTGGLRRPSGFAGGVL